MLYETPKIGRQVNDTLAEGTQVYHLDTRHLYYPKPRPILDPPPPASFRIGATIVNWRHLAIFTNDTFSYSHLISPNDNAEGPRERDESPLQVNNSGTGLDLTDDDVADNFSTSREKFRSNFSSARNVSGEKEVFSSTGTGGGLSQQKATL